MTLLRQHSLQYGFEVLGYCLMTNHVHLIGLPMEEHSLAKTIGRTHWKYSQILNHLHGRSGHVWQNRFYSRALDNASKVRAMAYVERNPVRAKMVREAWKYPWSSEKVHVEGRDVEGLAMERWRKALRGMDWLEVLKRKEAEGGARR